MNMKSKINRITTLSSLQAVQVPNDSRTYKAFSHYDLDQLTRENLDKTGFQLINSTYLAARNGDLAVGKYNIAYGEDPEMNYMLLWQNSYNKQISLKVCSGSHITICSNGMILGDLDNYYRKKHMSDVQTLTPEIIQTYIKQGAENFEKIVTKKEKMKTIEISAKLRAELLGRMFIQDEVITATQLGIIKGQIDNPSFDYGCDKNSLWQLYNHATLSAKEIHPTNYIKAHIDIDNFFTKEYKSELIIPHLELV